MPSQSHIGCRAGSRRRRRSSSSPIGRKACAGSSSGSESSAGSDESEVFPLRRAASHAARPLRRNRAGSRRPSHGLPRVDVKPSGQRCPDGAFGQQIFENASTPGPALRAVSGRLGESGKAWDRQTPPPGSSRRTRSGASACRPLQDGEIRARAAVRRREGGWDRWARRTRRGRQRLRDAGVLECRGGHDACPG